MPSDLPLRMYELLALFPDCRALVPEAKIPERLRDTLTICAGRGLVDRIAFVGWPPEYKLRPTGAAAMAEHRERAAGGGTKNEQTHEWLTLAQVARGLGW